MIPRPAARVLIVNPDGRTLLFRGIDPTDEVRGSWWFTPGGGVEDGETLTQAATREVLEETGLDVDSFGPVILTRQTTFDFADESYEAHETTFLLQLEERLVVTPSFTPLERAAILEHRWLWPDQIRALADPYYPDCLADLLERINAVGPPDEPWFEADGRW